jgi:hypothetical protein
MDHVAFLEIVKILSGRTCVSDSADDPRLAPFFEILIHRPRTASCGFYIARKRGVRVSVNDWQRPILLRVNNSRNVYR